MNLTLKKFQVHPFHLVAPSPWPILVSFSVMSIMLTLVFNMHGFMHNNYWVVFSAIVAIMSMALWFRDIISEATYLGDHTLAVRKGLNIGFILFVVSELFFFIAIFWAFFHSAMAPTIELGGVWPPVGIEAVGPSELPLLNTILLLCSGATLTWSHHALLGGNRFNTLLGLILTIVLAVTFMICQYMEYSNAPFTISDGIFGSVFYFGTGFHGLHIIIGIIMLSVSLWRIYTYQLTNNHHVGYETSILYYHFVDVVWLFLYIVFYWWGT